MNLKKKFVIGAASLALVAGMGVAPAMAAVIELPDGRTFNMDAQRLAGDNRLATSMAVAEKVYKDAKPTVAYLIGYDAVIDAATAGMLNINKTPAPAWDGPNLSCPNDVATQKMLGSYLKTKWPSITKVVAIGGTATVSDDALKTVATAAGAIQDRLGGKDRYETAVKIAEATKPAADLSRLYLARGDNPVDALSAGTLQKAPVLLLNPTGDANAAVKAFVKKHQVTFDEVVVIGGEASLSDEQVAKLWSAGELPKKPEVTPWTAEELKAGYTDAVKLAAAVLYGQNAWQTETNTDATPGWNYATPQADIDAWFATAGNDQKSFFPLKTAMESTAKKTANTSDVSTSAIPANGNYFEGYLPVKTDVDAAEVWANGGADGKSNVLALKGTLNTLLQKAINEGKTGTDIAGLATRDSDGNVTSCVTPPTGANPIVGADVCQAAQALYGLEFVKKNWPSVAADDSLTPGMFAFSGDIKTSTITGLSKDIEQLSAASASGNIVYVDPTTKALGDAGDLGKAPTGKTYNASYAALAERTSADDLTGVFGKNQTAMNVLAADSATSASINWWEIKKAVNKRTADYYKGLADAKKALVDAVKAYNWVGVDNASTKKSTAGSEGALRIGGENRYQTSAMLSVFQSKSDLGKPGEQTGEDRFADMKSVYLASGDPSYLIDPVFAGMVKDGTILLVPSKGTVDPLVATELKRKGTTPRNMALLKEGIKSVDVWAIGGKMAISDEVFQAAVDAMFAK